MMTYIILWTQITRGVYMLITNAKTLKHPEIEITTDEDKKYIINFNSNILLKDHEFDRIREDKEFFYKILNGISGMFGGVQLKMFLQMNLNIKVVVKYIIFKKLPNWFSYLIFIKHSCMTAIIPIDHY